MTRTLLLALATLALFTGCESITAISLGGTVGKDGTFGGSATFTLAKKKGLVK